MNTPPPATPVSAVEPASASSAFAAAGTVVIKLGSAVLTGADGGIDGAVLSGVCADVAGLIGSGKRVVLVTSGAVAAGRQALGVPLGQRLSIAEKQACAAVGQARLMQEYASHLGARGIPVAQILLSRGDMEDRRRYVNARYCLSQLLTRGALPIINENDTVTVDELRFGDNDGLAALVAVKLQADALWILSDVDGVYDSNPKANPNAKLLEIVPGLTEELASRLCGSDAPGVTVGSGGMLSKLRAAILATGGGVHVAIAQGKASGIIAALASGAFRGTFFPATGSHQNSRRAWILAAKPGDRRVLVDEGARRALLADHRSLLPAGITAVEGTFDEREIIGVAGPDGQVFALGISNYSSSDLARIRGHRADAIEEILGSCPYYEVIHRDNLAMLGAS